MLDSTLFHKFLFMGRTSPPHGTVAQRLKPEVINSSDLGTSWIVHIPECCRDAAEDSPCSDWHRNRVKALSVSHYPTFASFEALQWRVVSFVQTGNTNLTFSALSLWKPHYNGFFPPWKSATITATICFLSSNTVLMLCRKKKHLQTKEGKHVVPQ